jgi:hypothetical protein
MVIEENDALQSQPQKGDEESKVDLEKLAAEILKLIKQDLVIENERQGLLPRF